MTAVSDVAERLRIRIHRDLHVGRVLIGDRLPSCRVMADRLDVDHRTVARAYRTLAEEGLVEIRPRSGVFVAPQERIGRAGHDLLPGTVGWIQLLSAEGWMRNIPLTQQLELFERCLRNPSLKCVCVESVTDPAEAIAADLTRGLGVPVDVLLIPDTNVGRSTDMATFERKLCEADLAVTTVYHAGLVQACLDRACREVPLVVMSVSRGWRSLLQEAMSGAGLTVVHLHPDAPERFELLLEASEQDSVRFLSANQFKEVGLGAVEGMLHITEAARQVLDPDLMEAVHPPSAPLLSKATIMDITEAVIRINLERDFD